MITTALRSLWDEPRAADTPERGWRDWVLVGALMVTALLEGVLRGDVAWRPVATIVAVGLAPVLLWRRTRPLAWSWWRRTQPIEPLTEREEQVLALVARGRTNAGIAADLFIGLTTPRPTSPAC